MHRPIWKFIFFFFSANFLFFIFFFFIYFQPKYALLQLCKVTLMCLPVRSYIIIIIISRYNIIHSHRAEHFHFHKTKPRSEFMPSINSILPSTIRFFFVCFSSSLKKKKGKHTSRYLRLTHRAKNIATVEQVVKSSFDRRNERSSKKKYIEE